MALGKQMIVLSGGGHKGVVKLLRNGNSVKGSCSLDFRPQGASLYLVGDNVAKTDIKDINSTFEVPFSSESDISCVLRSSSVTMFGGAGNKADLLKKVDTFVKAKPAQAGASVKSGEPPRGEKGAKDMRDNDSAGGAANEGGADQSRAEERVAAESEPSFSARFASELIKYDGNNFYYAVKPQIDEMFVCYPPEEALSNAVDNSKWVRIDAEDGCYVVGLLFDDDEPTFICYGVPATRADRPPKELEDMCVWLPLGDKSEGGYWVIYQSAKTGEIVK